ncbi:MAG: D-glycero-beta-D-manno-heptose-7-phosphate kinase [Elusimicrobiota bacterium]
MQKELLKITESFPFSRIAVVGDCMLDRYIKGKVRRISPEAPVPVIEVNEEKSVPGGAANVASNIKALKANCILISLTGEDKRSEELINILEKKGIDTGGILRKKNFRTIEKIRIVAEHQQVARVDREEKFQADRSLLKELLKKIEKAAQNGAEAVIFSDYGKGIFNSLTIKEMMLFCGKIKLPVFVDPKVEHFKLYKNAACITPNTSEAFGGMRETVKYDQFSAQKLGEKIVKELSLSSLIITQSENGMTLFDNFSKKMKISHLPAKAREVFDVTGAGDTVISALAVAFSRSKDMLKSAMIANHAAAVAVSKLGTAEVSLDELKEDIKLWEKP